MSVGGGNEGDNFLDPAGHSFFRSVAHSQGGAQLCFSKKELSAYMDWHHASRIHSYVPINGATGCLLLIVAQPKKT